jgi:diketogulonate reductase-like aldo/keto reductase
MQTMTDSMASRNVTLSGGVAMPILGIGTWAMRGQTAYDALLHAIRVGYRHIDTATAYHNERDVGQAVRDSGLARPELFVTTKLPPENADRVRATIEASLTALGLDYVDLWLIHWPPGRGASPSTWRQLLAIRDEGIARSVGVSNYSPEQVDELIDETGEAPAVNQIRWSPQLFDLGRLEHSRDRGVVLEGYSPIKASDLADPVLREVAHHHGVTPAQVVLRWHIEHGVVVIPKSANPARIEENFDVHGFSLTPEEVRRIDGLSRHR